MGEPNVSYGIYQPRTPSFGTKNTAVLKKFMVHFRRPSDYAGKYGFDWLRDEYIHPIVTVTNDNNGTAIGAPTALCKNVANLTREYKDGTIYGKDYFPSWLAIFPHTTTSQFAHGSNMHKDGVKLDLEIEEIEALQQDDTELLFESNSQYLTITPNKLSLKTLIGTKKSKNLSGKVVNYYSTSKKITVKCSGGVLNSHGEIKVFAKLGTSPKVEVGKLKVFKNNIIPKAEIVAVNVITNPSQKASLRTDYQYLFKNQSFNQALIRAEVKVDTEFDLTSLANNTDVSTFLNNNHSYSGARKLDDIVSLYEKYGKYGNIRGGINSNNTHRTYLFFTSLSAGGTRGRCSLDINNDWGNSYIVFNIGLQNARTIIHECGHSFGLPHTFQEGSYAGPHIFYQGYTDAYMDYDWSQPSSANIYSGKMFSFYKWQWELMRRDRSLIFNY